MIRRRPLVPPECHLRTVNLSSCSSSSQLEPTLNLFKPRRALSSLIANKGQTFSSSDTNSFSFYRRR